MVGGEERGCLILLTGTRSEIGKDREREQDSVCDTKYCTLGRLVCDFFERYGMSIEHFLSLTYRWKTVVDADSRLGDEVIIVPISLIAPSYTANGLRIADVPFAHIIRTRAIQNLRRSGDIVKLSLRFSQLQLHKCNLLNYDLLSCRIVGLCYIS